MTDLGVLQEGRLRRSARAANARRARRRRRIRTIVVVLAVGLVALLVFMASGTNGPATPTKAVARARTPHPRERYATLAAPPREQVHVRFKKPPRSGLLFDVRSGRVLWQRDPTRRLPIASLTKMMTALVVVSRSSVRDRVRITRQAVHFSGSGVGLLPLGKRVLELTLLYGLMLPSGNDAAIALAQHAAGTRAHFIGLMNARARAMGLRCTQFASVSGIVDQGNHSCAVDLAVLAHAVLRQRALSRIVAARSAILPFPIKGGKLYLYNNNPLLILGYPGADGVKTGYTVAAGPCLVAAARRGRRWFGVVLLHSADPRGQAQRLLNAAFARR